MSVDSFNDTEQYILIFVLLLGLIAVPILLVCVIVLVVRRHRRHRPWRGTVLRALAGLATCTAVAVYIWGAIHLTADESIAYALCRATIPPAHAHKAFAYDVSFMPLRGQCRVEGVGTFDTQGVSGKFRDPLPTYVNPTVVVATCLALAFFIAVRRFPDGDSSEPEDPCERDRTEGLIR